MTSSSRDHLWILARQRQLDRAIQAGRPAKAEAWGFLAEDIVSSLSIIIPTAVVGAEAWCTAILKGLAMDDEYPIPNSACKSDEHTKHLCYYVSYGYHVENPQDYKDLVEEPRFVCQLCGRIAHRAESLCHPMNL